MASTVIEHPTFTFHHAELGPMTGTITPENVVQFKAVPFASIPARFKQSILMDKLPGTNTDFTKRGYACLQTLPNPETGGGSVPGDIHPAPTSEWDCLILQLNIPLSCLQSNSQLAKLPVLVYVHGGGFVLGKIDEEHNTAAMVEQSLLDAQPIISASIQYRLGAFGYLHTQEAGTANRALHDQKNALLWIQKFIDGFGGDREKVTVFGESAGSMSICAQMLSATPASGPLFQRAILMSGSLGPTTVPSTVEEAGDLYEMLLKTLGIQERGEAGLSKLRETDAQRVVEATEKLTSAGMMFLPVQDEAWFGKDAGFVTWDRIPELIDNCEWVNEIVLGTTGFEGTTFLARLASVTPRAFLAGIADQLGEENMQLTAQTYEIMPDMDQNLFLTRALRWLGDAIFDAPIHSLAKHLTTHTSKKVYRYIFDVRNPFPNHAFYQLAHHWVDIYFVFKTYQFRYPSQRLKDISTRHAQLWIDFANDKSPWREYKYTGRGDEVIMVADERDGWIERTVSEDEKMTDLSWRRCEALWDSWKKEEGRSFSPLAIGPLKEKRLV